MYFFASVQFTVLSFTSEEIKAFLLLHKCKINILLMSVVFVYIRKIKCHTSLYWFSGNIGRNENENNSQMFIKCDCSQTMGICPVRCRSNMSILENTSESATPGTQLQIYNSKMGNINVTKMQQTGLDLSLQRTRRPSPYPCVTTLLLGT